MPLYMDIHELPGATWEAMAQAHMADLKTQKRYGADYRKYWFNESCGKGFCLIEAPSAEAATQVHRAAHGFIAEKIIEVEPDLADAFLGGGDVDATGAVLLPGGLPDPAIRTILFTDIVGSTSLTQRLGDDGAMEFVRIHDTIVRAALAAEQGREIKHMGDGIMASFLSAAAAVRCALQIQREFARRDQSDLPIKLRIGAAAGEPVERGDDIFGSTVQLACRLCAQAEPDQILVANVVAELCMGKGLIFRSLGEVAMKGFEQPLQVHAVEWSPEAAGA